MTPGISLPKKAASNNLPGVNIWAISTHKLSHILCSLAHAEIFFPKVLEVIKENKAAEAICLQIKQHKTIPFKSEFCSFFTNEFNDALFEDVAWMIEKLSLPKQSKILTDFQTLSLNSHYFRYRISL